jgi:hypothetical protein
VKRLEKCINITRPEGAEEGISRTVSAEKLRSLNQKLRIWLRSGRRFAAKNG